MLDVEKYQFSIDLSPIPLMLVSSTGEIAVTNSPLDHLFEYEKGELTGKNVDILVPKDIRKHHPQLRKAYSRFPTKRRMGENRDLTGVSKTGARIPLELALEPIMDDEDTWALVVAMDIRSRKQSDERTRLVLDTTASAIISVDESSKIVFANKTALELTGYTVDQIVNQKIEILIPTKIQRVHPVYVDSFMHSKTARSMGKSDNIHLLHQDGRNIPVEIALTPVKADGKDIVVCTISDLSEQIQAQKLMTKKNAELAALNQDLTQFTYSASHDLKAPLSTIVGLIRVCTEDLDQDNLSEVRKNFTKIFEIARRSGKKVESILQIARASREKIPIEPISLKEEVDNIWTDLVAPKSKCVLKFDFNHQDPILTEKATFNVIIENLVSNAVRYVDVTKKHNEILIRTSESPTEIHISVIDNGIGIQEDNLTKIFLMFVRLDDRSGDGLGLSLVKKQVERLGGTISVSSELGKGATFDVVFPKKEGGRK